MAIELQLRNKWQHLECYLEGNMREDIC